MRIKPNDTLLFPRIPIDKGDIPFLIKDLERSAIYWNRRGNVSRAARLLDLREQLIKLS